MSKSIAIIFDDLTEFYGIRDAIDNLIKNDIDVDLYVSHNYSDELRVDTEKKISDLNYKVQTKFNKKKKYKVLLEPYPTINNNELDFEFRIRYRYAPVSVKPFPVYSPEWNLCYDAFIVYSKRDAEVFGAYGQTHLVPYSKFLGFKKMEGEGKPNLLYLPTYGEISSIEDIDQKTIKHLKQQYTVLIKAHHAVQFHVSEKSNYNKLRRFADEFYDSDTPLVDLLAKADVVLSDNSSAVFDAIYSETPVAILSSRHKLNQRKLEGISTLQYELVNKGIIPCAENSSQIITTIEQARQKLPEQKKVKYETFMFEEDNSSNHFVAVIQSYLNLNREDDLYYASKDILLNSWKRGQEALSEVDILRSALGESEEERNRIIENYESSTSWRITKPLRKIGNMVREIKK